MSINTSNMTTLPQGLNMASTAMEVNNGVFRNRAISLNVVFSKIAISEETEEQIQQSYKKQDLSIYKAISDVDIVQVQTTPKSSSGDPEQRALTIGALLSAKKDIAAARHVMLFARYAFADSRTRAQLTADGGRDPQTILSQDYKIEINTKDDFPFALVKILNGAGVHPVNGVPISASKYGRSRYRMLFNYIIDDLAGQASAISLSGAYYPYSSGYLSKTAFDEGISKYEKKIKEMSDTIENYIHGWQSSYPDIKSAISLASDRNIFFVGGEHKDYFKISNKLITNYTLPTSLYTEDPHVGSFVPTNTAPDAPYDNCGLSQLVAIFPVNKYKHVTYAKSGKTKLVPVTFVFVMWCRFRLQSDGRQPFQSAYNCIRVLASIPKEDGSGVYNYCKEIRKLEQFSGFLPNEPLVGKIEIGDSDESNVFLKFSAIVTEFGRYHTSGKPETTMTYEYHYNCVAITMVQNEALGENVATGITCHSCIRNRFYSVYVEEEMASASGGTISSEVTDDDGWRSPMMPLNSDLGYILHGHSAIAVQANAYCLYFKPDFDAFGGEENAASKVYFNHGRRVTETVLWENGDILTGETKVLVERKPTEVWRPDISTIRLYVEERSFKNSEYDLLRYVWENKINFATQRIISIGSGDGFVYCAVLDDISGQGNTSGISENTTLNVYAMWNDDIKESQATIKSILNVGANYNINTLKVGRFVVSGVIFSGFDMMVSVEFEFSGPNGEHVFACESVQMGASEVGRKLFYGAGNRFGQYINMSDYSDNGNGYLSMFGDTYAITQIVCQGEEGTTAQNFARAFYCKEKYIARKIDGKIYTAPYVET